MRRIRAIAITGPTASGKTSLSLEIAERLGGEIICLDSMQIYKKMDIGTAKATKDEQARVRHHMLDFLSPSEPYSAHSYKQDALLCAEEIASRGKIPIFVGGTGLYLDTLRRRGDVEAPEANVEYRDKILASIKSEEDKIALHQRLRELDRKSADAIHYNNVKRVIRAIEICERTGMPKSTLDELSALPDERLDILHITLDFHNRDTLYRRADERVLAMFREGLVNEALTLFHSGEFTKDATARFAIGYKEIIDAYQLGKPIDDAIPIIQQATRNYAKRQLTWFRRDKEAIRLYPDRIDGTLKTQEELCTEAFLILENFSR